MFTLRKSAIDLDLVRATITHLDFLKKVDDFDKLYRGELLANAIRRYEYLWLPMAARENTSQIAAPLDVEWVWYLHMLSPRVYDSDCKRLVSKVVDHKTLTEEPRRMALEKSREIWERLYPHEPFDVNPDLICKISAASSSQLSCDLLRAAAAQRNFYYQVSLPHYKDLKFLGNAVKRYKRFLHLHSSGSNEIFIPTCDIDIVWHAHLAHPLAYRKTCSSLFGHTLDHEHDDHSLCSNTAGICAAEITQERWFMTYSELYVLTGTTTRRDPPNPQTKLCADAWKDLAAPIYTLRLVKAAVSDFPKGSTYSLSINQNCGPEYSLTVINGSTSETCDDGLVTFMSAATNTDAPVTLSVKVTLVDTNVYNTLPVLFFPESLEAVLKESDITRPKVSKRDFKIIPPHSETAGKVSLTFQIMPPQRTGNYSLHVNQYEYVQQVPDILSGVTSPGSVSPPFMKEGPCSVFLYGLKSYAANDVFRCRIVQPLTSLLLAVEVSNVTGQVIASTCSMIQTELPQKGQVGKRLERFPYTKYKNDPKLLIRGRKDWGIAYSRAKLSSKVKLYVYLLESQSRMEILQSSRTSFKFKMHGCKEYIEVDTTSGDITIPKEVNAVPEILALCFSLKTLNLLKSQREVGYLSEGTQVKHVRKTMIVR